MSSSGGGQARGRKPALRTLQRQALAKQQAEQQQQQRQTKTENSSHSLTTVTLLPSYHVSLTSYVYCILVTRKKFAC